MATAVSLSLPWGPAVRRGAALRRPASTWHDALLLSAIALTDILPSVVFGADPSLGPTSLAALVAFLLPLVVVSLGSGALLLACARRLVAWTVRPAAWFAAAAAVVLALAALRAGVWWADVGLSGIARKRGLAIPPEALAILWLYTGLIVGPLVIAYERSRRRRDAAMRRLVALQQAQREAEQRVTASRLRAMQGRVDPQLLTLMLAKVGRAYEDDPAHAEQLLDGLIAFLRLSTSRTREQTPTLGQELALAAAYQRLRGLARLPVVALDTLAAEPAGDAPFPAGAVLALLDEPQQAAGAEPLALHAVRTAGRLRLDGRLPSPPSADALARAGALLADAGGRLDARPDGAAWRVTMEVPDEAC